MKIEKSKDQNIKLFINTRKHFLLSIVGVWAIVAMVFFAIKPQISPINNLRDQLKKERATYLELNKKLQDLNNIQVSEEFQKKNKVDEVLPSHKPVTELLFNLYQTMNSSNTKITALNINPGEIYSDSEENLIQTKAAANKKNNKYGTLSMELIVTGDENGVDEFLSLVEKISPLTSVVELTIANTKDKQKNPITQAEMLLHTYYYTQVITTSIDSELPSINEEELKVFETIQKFTPSEFRQPDEIESANIEDLFGIEGFEF